MTFIGYYTSIKIDEGYEKCPEFWDKEYAEKYHSLFETMNSENDEEQAVLDNGIGMYALCVNDKNVFQYWITGEYKGGKVPENFSLYTSHESEWLYSPQRVLSPLQFRNSILISGMNG